MPQNGTDIKGETTFMPLPLEGITVVSAEQALAAPFASRHLADLGATVIKLERPDGGDFARRYDRTVNGLASAFVWLNRSKKSLTLDLSHPESAEVLDALLDRADVFLHNLKPSTLPKLGLETAKLQARHEQLIVCDISGYGDATGRFADKKAYDLLVQAEVGLLSITGTEQEPAKAGISVADIAAGSYAFSGILAALFERERTGLARAVSVSLLDSLAEWMGHPMYYATYGGVQPARAGTSHGIIAPYGPFTVGDGSTVVLAVQNHGEWVDLCTKVLGRPELVDHPDFVDNTARVAHRVELATIIQAELAGMTDETALALLDAAGIANARLNTIQGFVDDHRAALPHRWTQVDTPVGPVDAMLPLLPRGVEAPMGPVPALGEHTDEVLRWLGLSETHIDTLRDRGTTGARTT